MFTADSLIKVVSGSEVFMINVYFAAIVCVFQVGSVVGRADLLCALFLFCGFLAFCRAVRCDSVTFTLLTLAAAALSMFCKEQGITLLVSAMHIDSL